MAPTSSPPAGGRRRRRAVGPAGATAEKPVDEHLAALVDTDAAADGSAPSNDERLRRDVPPHHGG